MEHFKPVRLFFLENLSSCTVIQDYTVIGDIRVDGEKIYIQNRIVTIILTADRLRLNKISYLYVIPFS